MRHAVNELLQIGLDLLQHGSNLRPVCGYCLNVSLNILQSNHKLQNQVYENTLLENSSVFFFF